MPGMIWGKVLRSPHPHARIKSINTKKAEADPGVKAVMTAKDIVEFPLDKSVMLGIQDMRWMAATSWRARRRCSRAIRSPPSRRPRRRIAAEACKLIEVEYEVLPFVIDVEEAMKPGAPILHDFLKFEGKPSNIAGTLEHKLGDVDAGFAEGRRGHRAQLPDQAVHQGYIEPHACLVSVSDGKATIWSSSQGQFMVRAMCALLTGIPQNDIRAIPAEIGGGFGGKTIIYLEPLALVLATKTGRPVKMVMTRDEVFHASGPTSGSYQQGQDRRDQGRHDRRRARHLLPAGRRLSRLADPRRRGLCLRALRHRERALARLRRRLQPLEGRGLSRARRADRRLCRRMRDGRDRQKLKMDPLQLRLKNAAKKGTKAAHGPVFPLIGFVETMKQALAHPHYKTPLKPNQGRGVACGFWFNAGGEFERPGERQRGRHRRGDHRPSRHRRLARVDGQHRGRGAGHRLQQNTGVDRRHQRVGFSNLTGGSRVTYASAMVVTQSTEKVITILRKRAAKIWKIDPDAVVWENGEARPAGDNAGQFEPLSLGQIAAQATATGGPIGAGSLANTTGAEGGFATHICDVEVDRDSASCGSCATPPSRTSVAPSIPSYVEGQMQGGVAQGIGWALSEEYIYDKNGRLDNPSFLDYRMPVTSDLPMLDSVIIEVPNPKHPQGVRGVGEVPLVPPMAAVANAIHGALGQRFDSLPMSPPKVLAAMELEAA